MVVLHHNSTHSCRQCTVTLWRCFFSVATKNNIALGCCRLWVCPLKLADLLLICSYLKHDLIKILHINLTVQKLICCSQPFCLQGYLFSGNMHQDKCCCVLGWYVQCHPAASLPQKLAFWNPTPGAIESTAQVSHSCGNGNKSGAHYLGFRDLRRDVRPHSEPNANGQIMTILDPLAC